MPFASGSDGDDVIIKFADGVAVPRGQQTKANSVPTTLASDQIITSQPVNGGDSINSKFRVEVSTTPITIPSSVTYTTIYTYTGSGMLFGFNSEFNSTAVVLRLQIDGETILDGISIATYNGLVITTNDNARRQSGSGVVTTSSTFDFSLRLPIKYASSVVISARADAGIIARTFNQGAVYISKEP